MNGVKMEVDPQIKPDPDTKSPGGPGFADIDDMYEDTGELNIPTDFADRQVWLTRVPKWLWEVLSKAEDDEEVEIGRILEWQEANDTKVRGDMSRAAILLTCAQRKLQLRQTVNDFTEYPKEYKLNVTNPQPLNEFVFSEKDLEGYNPNAYKRPGRQGQQGTFAGQGTGVKDGRVDKWWNKGGRGGKKQPIPKHTTLVARSSLDVNCIPVDNAELARFRMRENKKTQQASNRLVLENNLHEFTRLIGGTTPAGNPTIDIQATRAKPKSQDNKFARIPQNQLLDMLLKLFQEYKYWPIKALKDRTRQPEAYLRETLSKIATLVRTGQFANTWMLNKDAEESNYLANLDETDVKEEMAPEPEFGEDDDEGDEEMEDAL
ncbi:Transcription initiation factor IIF beta subunit [Lasiodiplodia theobromae]|nr:Transcription initiation factor IIF beta subunit [Lasiodiplodia theobromae]